MTTKNNSTAATIVAWVASASVEGITRLMLDIEANHDHFTDEQNNAIAQLVKDDNFTKAAAKLSAAEETGLDGYDSIVELLPSCTFDDYKTVIHAIDVRLTTLPDDQRTEVLEMYEFSNMMSQLGSLPSDADGIVDPTLDEVDGEAPELNE